MHIILTFHWRLPSVTLDMSRRPRIIDCQKQFGKHAMATGGTTGVIGQLNDPEYLNWIKATRAIHITMEALRSFCNAQMKHMHNLLQISHVTHGRTRCSVPCSGSNIKYDRYSNVYSINCPNNVCSQWLTGIAAHRATSRTRLNTDNCDISQWPEEPWQSAKAFMNRGQDRATVAPSDTDASGILNLLTNCSFFIPLVDKQNTNAVRVYANSLNNQACMQIRVTFVCGPFSRARVAAADYASTIALAYPFSNTSFKLSLKLPTRSVIGLRSCAIIVGDFSHTLVVLHAICSM